MAAFVDQKGSGFSSWGLWHSRWWAPGGESQLLPSCCAYFIHESPFTTSAPVGWKLLNLEKRYQLAYAIYPVTSNNTFIVPFIVIAFVLKKTKLYSSKFLMFSFLLRRKGNVRLSCKACVSLYYMKDSDIFGTGIQNYIH